MLNNSKAAYTYHIHIEVLEHPGEGCSSPCRGLGQGHVHGELDHLDFSFKQNQFQGIIDINMKGKAVKLKNIA